MYADLTEEQKLAILRKYDAALPLATDPAHAVVIASHDVLCPSIRGLNGKKGSNAFAAALATVVMADRVELRPRTWES